MQFDWPWNVNVDNWWDPPKRFHAKCREKVDKAAFIAAEIACGTWDFGDKKKPTHANGTVRIPLNYVRTAAGWSPQSTNASKYLKSRYFREHFDHEMQRREQGYVGELAQLGDELETKGESFLKVLSKDALEVLYKRLNDPHSQGKISNHDLIALAAFGLNMDAKINAAQKTRDSSTPSPLTIRADVLNIMDPSDPRLAELARMEREAEKDVVDQ